MSKDVVSLPIAKKLKEAGWKQAGHENYRCSFGVGCTLQPHLKFDAKEKCVHFAAPTIGELLEATDVLEMRLYALRKPDGGKDYLAYPIGNEDITGRSANPADALALLWMALKEKNLV